MATAILAVALATIGGVLLSTEQHVRGAATRQRNVERCRQLAEALARELRDANFTDGDFEPNAPLDDTSIEYRKVVGWDAMTGVTLSPTRASGEFRRIALVNGTVTMSMPGLGYTMAEGVADLRFTLEPPNLLLITVRFEAADGHRDASDGQDTIADGVAVTVAMRNQLP